MGLGFRKNDLFQGLLLHRQVGFHLAEMLRPHIPNLVILKGGLGKKDLQNVLDHLKSVSDEEPCLLLATGKFVGEGFDQPRLDTLFVTLPVSWRGTVAQYVGRLHRLHEGKHEVRVYDYADLNVHMLARMFDRRCAGYEAMGYSIQLPGSAVPRLAGRGPVAH